MISVSGLYIKTGVVYQCHENIHTWVNPLESGNVMMTVMTMRFVREIDDQVKNSVYTLTSKVLTEDSHSQLPFTSNRLCYQLYKMASSGL